MIRNDYCCTDFRHLGSIRPQYHPASACCQGEPPLKTITLVAAVSAALAAAPAFAVTASSSASASLGAFSYSLLDLDTSDGINTSISFSSAVSAPFATATYLELPANSYQTTTDTSGATTVTVSTASSLATATISTTLSAAGSTSPVSGNYGSFYAAASVPGSSGISFTVTANTQVTFSALATVYAYTEGTTATSSYASAAARFDIADYGGGSLSTSTSSPATLQQLLSFTLINSTATTFSGLLSASVVAVGSVSAVPEPETWALMLAGFGLLSAVARRRDSSSNLA